MGTDVLSGGMSQVTATAPLAEVMHFQSQLKSITGGQGSFSMELSHYDPVPPLVAQQLIANYKPHPEQDE
jgi:elongation factor G